GMRENRQQSLQPVYRGEVGARHALPLPLPLGAGAVRRQICQLSPPRAIQMIPNTSESVLPTRKWRGGNRARLWPAAPVPAAPCGLVATAGLREARIRKAAGPAPAL